MDYKKSLDKSSQVQISIYKSSYYPIEKYYIIFLKTNYMLSPIFNIIHYEPIKNILIKYYKLF